MLIAFTPRTPTHHELSVRRNNGSVDSVLLETRSYLVHDLAHLAVEAEAGLARGVWGTVAAGVRLDALRRELDDPGADELWAAERLAALLQSHWGGRLDEGRYLELVRGMGGRVDDGFPARAMARMRALWGHWRSTRHGTAMEVTWP